MRIPAALRPEAEGCATRGERGQGNMRGEDDGEKWRAVRERRDPKRRERAAWGLGHSGEDKVGRCNEWQGDIAMTSDEMALSGDEWLYGAEEQQ
ncbi:hypothetical protein OsJ_21460 [Oryza sativa Japonica Group]|uniref:Uncharacterized protein n=1 Tax=Oryza sativa subsp. japonica TaxID=39947 RepID=Q654K9_ORYSJ|nr:hypothetical protein OsJ_21460 [Oryza sativa Japonica Group]BAD45758.1 hypothetical protein [Oryza sativa Japonica Group]